MREFTHYSLEEDYLIGYLDVHKGRMEFELIAMNKSDIKDMLFGHTHRFNHAETRSIEAIIVRKLGKHRTNKREDGTPKQRSWLVRRNPGAQDRKLWPNSR